MKEMAFASIQEIKNLIGKKEVSSTEVVSYFIDRLKKYDDLGASLEVFDAHSVTRHNTTSTGILFGIPGLLKDNIAQQGRLLTCASRSLEGYTATYDATVTERLQQAGAPILGRANMDEFAMGSSNETSAFRKVKNPWDTSRVPGGSSGGSVAAVAAGLVPWSLGSETGGSVRLPASFCGVVGLKPTYGLVSRYGLVAYASSLDQIGPVTRTVADNALVLSAMAGHDAHDSSTLNVPHVDYTALLTGNIPAGLRIGIVSNAIHAKGMDPEISNALEQAINVFRKLGATVHDISLPALEYGAATYFIISRAEAASNLARFDGVRYGLRDKTAETLADMYRSTRHDGFGPEVRARILVGNYVLSAGYARNYYANAQKAQRLILKEFNDAFKQVDVLLMPTHSMPAFKLGAFDLDKLQMDLQDYFTCGMNLAGIPALALPCGMTKTNLPIGMQLVGPHLSEQFLYQIAYAYEQETPWHTMRPAGF